MNAAELAAAEAESMKKVVGRYPNLVTGKVVPITWGEMHAAFDKVKSAAHWKDPIVAEVPYETAMLFVEAVTFFHGARPRLTREPKGLHDTTTPYTLTGYGYVC